MNDNEKEITYLVISEWAVIVGLILTFLSGLMWGFFIAVLLIT